MHGAVEPDVSNDGRLAVNGRSQLQERVSLRVAVSIIWKHELKWQLPFSRCLSSAQNHILSKAQVLLTCMAARWLALCE